MSAIHPLRSYGPNVYDTCLRLMVEQLKGATSRASINRQKTRPGAISGLGELNRNFRFRSYRTPRPLSVSSEIPFYHAGSGRLEDERYPQNAAHFGSPTRRQAGRLRRSSTRLNPAPCASLVFKTEERQMLTIADQIRELRAELTGCLLTRRERAQAQSELKRLVAKQAKLNRALDAAVAEEAPPD
jgi:hypothetical protein